MAHFPFSKHPKSKIFFLSISNTLNPSDLAIRFGQMAPNLPTGRVYRDMRFPAKSPIESAGTVSAQKGRSATAPTPDNRWCGGRGREYPYFHHHHILSTLRRPDRRCRLKSEYGAKPPIKEREVLPPHKPELGPPRATK